MAKKEIVPFVFPSIDKPDETTAANVKGCPSLKKLTNIAKSIRQRRQSSDIDKYMKNIYDECPACADKLCQLLADLRLNISNK